MNITITHTVYRNDDEDVTELECTGTFYRGEFEGYQIEKPNEHFVLTEAEDAAIVEALTQAKADDWDEDKFKAERERE